MTEFHSWKVDHGKRGTVVSKKQLPNPPGYSHGTSEVDTLKQNAKKGLDANAKMRKANALRQKAMDPAKSAGFMCFMLWMSGNSLQIFSIMMLVSCVHSPIQAILNVTKAFPPDKDVDVMINNQTSIGGAGEEWAELVVEQGFP
eukprot:TRINITY_DN50012_c0_g1_i2.p1 TRINITY_DN50012_c0_g1~~TRINITY_DN50012_c0_g1_i2.p1  ORF type:complete len:144 (+),score=9.64 TRINITY_DN50012_c0_g1_i2:125-556(+)